MAKFYAKGTAIFQEPVEKTASDGSKSISMGFRVAICDNGDGSEENNSANAQAIVKALNQQDDLKEIADWLLRQKSLYVSRKRYELLKGIVKS